MCLRAPLHYVRRLVWRICSRNELRGKRRSGQEAAGSSPRVLRMAANNCSWLTGFWKTAMGADRFDPLFEILRAAAGDDNDRDLGRFLHAFQPFHDAESIVEGGSTFGGKFMSSRSDRACAGVWH